MRIVVTRGRLVFNRTYPLFFRLSMCFAAVPALSFFFPVGFLVFSDEYLLHEGYHEYQIEEERNRSKYLLMFERAKQSIYKLHL